MNEDPSFIMKTKKTTLKVVLIHNLYKDHESLCKEIHVLVHRKIFSRSTSDKIFCIEHNFLSSIVFVEMNLSFLQKKIILLTLKNEAKKILMTREFVWNYSFFVEEVIGSFEMKRNK